MGTTAIDIHVGIPSFNNVDDLRRLLVQLREQDFASVTVLDDSSTDGTAEMVSEFKDFCCVRSEVNLGTVGANNLMLQNMPKSGFILFIDSDMQLQTKNIPQILSAFLENHPGTGAGVGRIVDVQGQTIRWNYGYDINFFRSTFAFFTYHPAVALRKVPLLGNFFKQLSLPFTQHLASNEARKIDWGIEAFFFVRADLFEQLSGFDSRFKRFHEGPDLFLQIRKLGYQTWFTPDILAVDTDQGTGTSWYRRYHWWRSLGIYFRKNPSRLFIWRFPRN